LFILQLKKDSLTGGLLTELKEIRDMSKLFEPINFRKVRLRNRIVCSPMCQYSSEDGFANDWHLVHLGSRAIGGAGLIIVEATAVSAEGRITPSDLGLWKDEHIHFLQRITTFLKAHGAVAGIQLAHAGRKASHHVPWKGGQALNANESLWETLAPSAIAFKEGEPTPREMSEDDINKVIADFQQATIRARKAGFELIEIHAAHGYLISEFLSPISNHRRDKWGGSFENRCRLLLEIISAIRKQWSDDQPLFVRISATDWVEGGWTADDSVQLAKVLKQNGVDLVDCSSGGNASGARIPVGPMYQVPFAEKVKKEAGMLTGAVGMITTATEAASIIAEGKADLVIIARELLRDPYFPLHAAKILGEELPWPVQYERAKLK
jgi:2,4-dienoyl-CoA reductase-like NADH-dependent reductase (Old Yellow Enzyme family)